MSPVPLMFDAVAGRWVRATYRPRAASVAPTTTPPPPLVADVSTMNGHLVALCQGFHKHVGDGVAGGSPYLNWFKADTVSPRNAPMFDNFPDVAEYSTTYNAGATAAGASDGHVLANGLLARLYADADPSVALTHMGWMRDYGIDGASCERFYTAVANRAAAVFTWRNKVLGNYRDAAAATGRTYHIMYDMSSYPNNNTAFTVLRDDWKYLVDNGYISDRYQRHTDRQGRNRPYVYLWGVGGFTNNVDDTTTETAGVASLIDYWKNGTDGPQYRATVGVSVNVGWRSSPRWPAVILSADVIAPWTVGRYSASSPTNTTGISAWITTNTGGDLAYIAANTSAPLPAYLPTVFPGSSDYNREGANGRDNTTASNYRPRWGGHFLWNQSRIFLETLRGQGFPDMLFVATFDECNEGTCIYKIENDPAKLPRTTPTPIMTTSQRNTSNVQTGVAASKWVGPNHDGVWPGGPTAVPTDWYLRVAGELSRVVKGGRVLTTTLPITP